MRRRLPILLLLIALAAPAAAQAPDMRQLEREIERLRGELVELGAAEQAGEGAAGVQRGRLVELNVRERALKAKIDANRGDLARLLGALQTYQRRPPPPLLVNPRSARDAVRAAILIRAITPRLEARGRAFAVQAEEIAKLRRTAAAASETLFQAESDIADRRAEIERLTTEKSGLERQLYADAGLADPETRALAARAGSVADFVERLDRGKRAAPRNPPAKLLAPVQGTLARRFGDAQEGRERSQRAGAEPRRRPGGLRRPAQGLGPGADPQYRRRPPPGAGRPRRGHGGRGPHGGGRGAGRTHGPWRRRRTGAARALSGGPRRLRSPRSGALVDRRRAKADHGRPATLRRLTGIWREPVRIIR